MYQILWKEYGFEKVVCCEFWLVDILTLKDFSTIQIACERQAEVLDHLHQAHQLAKEGKLVSDFFHLNQNQFPISVRLYSKNIQA